MSGSALGDGLANMNTATTDVSGSVPAKGPCPHSFLFPFSMSQLNALLGPFIPARSGLLQLSFVLLMPFF